MEKNVILEYGDAGAASVLIQPVDEHDLEGVGREVAAIGQATDAPFRLIAVRVENWDRDLSPWSAPAVFGREDFAGGAAATLDAILSLTADKSKKYYIGGYSLAALFALWSVCRTDVFAGCAAASPSLWFPGFTGFMEKERIMCPAVYLSLGDREEKARNALMATVGDRVREAYALLAARGVDCVLEWNEGNHFKDADLRTAKAFAWLINRRKKE